MPSKHTPGPWFVAPLKSGRSTYANTLYVRSTAEKEPAVCRIGRRSWTEQQANANLIAAAPKLVEFVANAENTIGQYLQSGEVDGFPELLREAKAILQKIDGDPA